MVAFNERRERTYDFDEVLPRVSLGSRETAGKDLVAGRFLVRGIPTDEGRKYVLDEMLPNGSVIHREGEHDSRSVARRVAATTAPTKVYDI